MYTILIACSSINDTENILSLIRRDSLPLAATTVRTGETALARILDEAGASPFDILFADIGMPFQEEIVLSRQVRKLSPRTRIILCSDFRNPECVREAVFAGVQDYLVKPASLGEISSAIRRLLSFLTETRQQEQFRIRQSYIVKSHLLWLALHDQNFPQENGGFLESYYHMLMLENKNEYFSGPGASFWRNLEKLPLPDLISFSTHLEEIYDMRKNKKTHSIIYMKYCFLELAKIMLEAGCAGTDTDALTDQIFHSASLSDLLRLLRVLADSSGTASGEVSADSLKVDKIKQFIRQHYDEQLSLNDIAAHFYITPNYLCALFKKETGGNVMRYLNDYRLKRAREFLLTTQMKIHLVAETVGFRNVSYFCQKFRDTYGETPENFRQKTAVLSSNAIR
ncbi:helix-turn-helix domain-containing protein [Acetatifactor aquisgranensis]|uniref:helix-turn-helix domain-containing protein n=1 Tax=Acetatifactor aquisgranensis TaxID=2941233 RepID=UPI00203EE31B|nr:helix-turn-helix domain-containing protein [Acetatifactor aquisgranensis]